MSDGSTRLKGSCAEFLGLFGLLRHWVEVEAPIIEELADRKKSFSNVCGIIDLILHIKRGIVSTSEGADKLAALCTEFMRHHKAAHRP